MLYRGGHENTALDGDDGHSRDAALAENGRGLLPELLNAGQETVILGGLGSAHQSESNTRTQAQKHTA